MGQRMAIPAAKLAQASHTHTVAGWRSHSAAAPPAATTTKTHSRPR
jgi:hypothetical protein